VTAELETLEALQAARDADVETARQALTITTARRDSAATKLSELTHTHVAKVREVEEERERLRRAAERGVSGRLIAAASARQASLAADAADLLARIAAAEAALREQQAHVDAGREAVAAAVARRDAIDKTIQTNLAQDRRARERNDDDENDTLAHRRRPASPRSHPR
jgi:flagellar biosynthesis chaperone FliJ